MKLFTHLLIACALLSVGDCAAAKPITNVVADSTLIDLHLSGFDAIKLGGPFDLYLTQGNEESVKIAAPQELLPRITAEVKDGVLKIHRKMDNWGWGENSWWSDKGVWHNRPHIAVYVTAKNLEALTVAGSGQIIFSNGFEANVVHLRVSGSGNIKGKITAQKLTSVISGSGNISLTGKAENSVVHIAGSGTFSCRDLATVSTSTHVSGSGNAEVNASAELDATISGSGGVNYTGSATSVHSKTSGSGHISKI